MLQICLLGDILLTYVISELNTRQRLDLVREHFQTLREVPIFL